MTTAAVCQRMVARYIGNPEEPFLERQPCGRTAKYRLRNEGSGMSIFVCGRHARWSAALRGILRVTIEPIGPDDAARWAGG